jgi:NAD+ synthase (glutamine-hydrolysing)
VLQKNPVLPEYEFFPKTLAPNYREFDEARYFIGLRDVALENQVPLESLLPVVQIAGEYPCGLMICEDSWHETYTVEPAAMYAKAGAKWLINLSASPYTLGKEQKRHRLFAATCKRLQVHMLYVNAVGLQNNGKTLFAFDGASAWYGPQGQILWQAPACVEQVGLEVEEAINNSKVEPLGNSIAQIYTALKFAVTRYMEQSGLQKVVIGASGGIDSAVCAALLSTIIEPEQMLLVNMPSRYNSKTTISLAQKLAQALGCFYAEVPIEESVAHTRSQIDGLKISNARATQELSLSEFHLENIQARDRSSRILAALAAAFGGVFTCNANKTETMVGYSTLYGDHGGFLAPLADLWKWQVYELGHYLNEHVYKREVIPAGIFTIVPSAELSSAQNVEEGKGDPIVYEYHDRLFAAWMQNWNRLTPEDILNAYKNGSLESLLGLPKPLNYYFADVASWISDLEKWWKLYKGMGIAKRVQSPPIVAISRRCFGFDLRESLLAPYFTQNYEQLRSELLAGIAP